MNSRGTSRSVCKDLCSPSLNLSSFSFSPSHSILVLHLSLSQSLSLSLSLLSLSLTLPPSPSSLSLTLFSFSISPLSPSSHSIGPKVISLRKCGISDPPTNYYLAEVVDAARNERELQPSECLYDLKQIGYYGPLKLYIRARVS